MFLGRFSNISKEYAQKFFSGSYFYLTPKQGLLRPEQIVEKHEITKSPSFDDPEAIKFEELKKQCQDLGLKEFELIVFLGMNHLRERGWVSVLEQLLEDRKDRLFCPLITFKEENFGLAKIKDAMITGVPLFFSEIQNPIHLKKIEIKKLFDQYDYPEISLFTKEKLTILVAPNGFGKTTILELLYNIFSLKIAEENEILRLITKIRNIPFESIRLVYENNASITFQHTKPEKPIKKKNDPVFFLDDLARKSTLSNALPFIPIKFIKSSRLTEYSEYSIRRAPDRDTEITLLKTYSQEIQERMGALFSIYAEVTDDYECTAIKRLLESPEGTKSFHKFQKEPYPVYAKEEAIEEILKLEKERDFLRDKGFLMLNRGLPYQADTSKITDDPELLKTLTLHIHDSYEKYQLFQMLRKKMDLLEDIIQDLLIGKEFSITHDHGFEVTQGGRLIDLSKLSSGEQHQIILYYDLIFNSEPGTLVLIDEPEISIHIEWQRQFLKNLEKISSRINCDFIVTTHSPDIVNDKWNLIVQLKEGIS